MRPLATRSSVYSSPKGFLLWKAAGVPTGTDHKVIAEFEGFNRSARAQKINLDAKRVATE